MSDGLGPNAHIITRTATELEEYTRQHNAVMELAPMCPNCRSYSVVPFKSRHTTDTFICDICECSYEPHNLMRDDG